MEQTLIIRDRVISEDPIKILETIKSELFNGKLSSYRMRGSGIAVTCPFHADGKEHRPSCYLNLTSDTAPYLYMHCFTCGTSGTFAKFVGLCFNKNEEFGENWLLSRFANDFIDHHVKLEPIVLGKNSSKYLDESILDSFESYHPYMTKRKLTQEIISKFNIKYDPKTRCIVFPVRDIYGNLKFLTRRSVDSKKFIIDEDADKSNIYLLDYIVKNNIKEVVVCESQLNALTCWCYGVPAIALFGAGTTREQMNALNNSPVRHFILGYDPDEAGLKGVNKFKKLVSKTKFVDVLDIPIGKDINDLTKEEFLNLMENMHE